MDLHVEHVDNKKLPKWHVSRDMLGTISRCGGDEKTEWPRRTDKSRTLNFFYKKIEKQIPLA